MVISAFNRFFPSATPRDGSGILDKCQGDAHCPVELTCLGGQSLSFPRLPASAAESAGERRKKSQGAVAPMTLYLVLWKHLRKYNEYKCPHLSRPSHQTVLWVAAVGAEQSRLPFLQSPRLCRQSPKFSLSEHSRNEFFQSQRVAFELTLTRQNQLVNCHKLH